MEYAQAAPKSVAMLRSSGGCSYSQTGIDRVADLYVQGPGVLYASAGNNINLTAAEIAGNGAVQLDAGNNVNLQTVKTSQTNNFNAGDAKNHLLTSQTSDAGSTISAKNVSVIADQNLVSVGTEFKGSNSVYVEGKDTTTLYAATNTRQSSTTTQSTTTLGGALSAIAGGITLEEKTTTDSQASASSIGTKLISNEKVVIGVGNKTELQSTEVEAPQIAFVKTDPSKKGRTDPGRQHQHHSN